MSAYDAIFILRTSGGYLAVRRYCGMPTQDGLRLHGQCWNGHRYTDEAEARTAAIALADQLGVPHENCYTDMYLHADPLSDHILNLAPQTQYTRIVI